MTTHETAKFFTLAELLAAEWPDADPNWKPVLFYRPTKLLTNPQPDLPWATILSIVSIETAAAMAALPNANDLSMPGELFAVVPDGQPWAAIAALIAEATAKYRLGAVYIDAHSLDGATKTDGWQALVPIG